MVVRSRGVEGKASGGKGKSKGKGRGKSSGGKGKSDGKGHPLPYTQRYICFWTSAKSTTSGSRAQHFDDVLNFAELGNIDVSVETVVDSMIIRPTLRHGFAPTTTHWEQKHGHGAHDKKVSSGGKKC
jgi:hypothetical protein